ncbi:MAG: chorismate lyase [Pseudomonadales bacterium]|nr:chorismate lyase [Pseudomonadales bacterium]
MTSFAPQSQINNLVKSLAFRGVPRFQVPRQYRNWLFDSGSLTKRLVKATEGDFRVELLRQTHSPMWPDEQKALDSPARSLPLIREVYLICNGEPWVFARTVIPRTTETGAGRYLTRLGSKPLGAALFNDPNISRGPIFVKKLRSSQQPSQGLAQADLWGRHSTFFLCGEPLLVCEYFLPCCPMYQQDT